jgi:hypothetical protein
MSAAALEEAVRGRGSLIHEHIGTVKVHTLNSVAIHLIKIITGCRASSRLKTIVVVSGATELLEQPP